jgi:hypothetical protein
MVCAQLLRGGKTGFFIRGSHPCRNAAFRFRYVRNPKVDSLSGSAEPPILLASVRAYIASHGSKQSSYSCQIKGLSACNSACIERSGWYLRHRFRTFRAEAHGSGATSASESDYRHRIWICGSTPSGLTVESCTSGFLRLKLRYNGAAVDRKVTRKIFATRGSLRSAAVS